MSNRSIGVIRADLIKWLRGNRWLLDNGYLQKFHAIIGDTPYFLGSIVERFGGANAAPAQYGRDGAFVRQSRGFMGQQWDGFESVYHYQAWVTEWASLMLDYAYPNAICAFFGGSRTYHRVAAGLEDAGWIVFDCVHYMYGQGFPKSHNVQLDYRRARRGWSGAAISNEAMLTVPLEERLRLWKLEREYAGYGSALKPAYEPIILARAPRGSYTLAQCAELFNTGILNIDGARVYTDEQRSLAAHTAPYTHPGYARPGKSMFTNKQEWTMHERGRYPANIVLDEEAAALLNQHSGERKTGGNGHKVQAGVYGKFGRKEFENYGDTGGASRFFYTAKAPTWEREAGLDEFDSRIVNDGRETPIDNPYQRGDTLRKNLHPTVKPIQLTEWLARLLLPPNRGEPRRLLVPFAGVASEMIGGYLAGWDDITGIEREEEYTKIAQARLDWWIQFDSYAGAAAAYKAAHGGISDEPEGSKNIEQLSLF